MANRPLPSPEILRQLLRYDPETGKLFWRERSREMFADTSDHRGRDWACSAWNARWAGKGATTPTKSGHLSVTINYSRYLAHRVIWKLTFGDEPARIDHRDTNGSNNRIANLRAATVSQNGMNRPPPANNSSGVKGVSYRKDTGKWSAQITVRGKTIRLGCFTTLEAAADAYRTAALEYHGAFARTS